MENIIKIIFYSLLLTFSLSSTSCSPSHDSALGLSSNEQFILNPNPDESLKTAAQSAITNSCFNCHGPGGSPAIFESDGGSVDMDALLNNSDLVSIGNPGNSLLYNSIFEVRMPASTPAESFFTDTAEQNAVFSWIEDIGIPDPNAGGDDDGDGGGTPPVGDATFSEVERLVLTPYCYSCHASSQPVFTNYNSVVNSIVIPNSVTSTFLTSMRDPDDAERMPRGQAALDTTLIELVEAWILNGAPND